MWISLLTVIPTYSRSAAMSRRSYLVRVTYAATKSLMVTIKGRKYWKLLLGSLQEFRALKLSSINSWASFSIYKLSHHSLLSIADIHLYPPLVVTWIIFPWQVFATSLATNENNIPLRDLPVAPLQDRTLSIWSDIQSSVSPSMIILVCGKYLWRLLVGT